MLLNFIFFYALQSFIFIVPAIELYFFLFMFSSPMGYGKGNINAKEWV